VGGGLCDINFGMGDLVGGTSGDRGGVGAARSWWSFFSDVAPFLGGERGRAGRREKIRADLKTCNESWSLCRGRLARETLAIKWRGLCCVHNAGWSSSSVSGWLHTPQPRLCLLICGAYYTKSGFIYNVCVRKRINRVLYNVRLTHVINNTVLYITCLY
jgi:hypothetical protein